MTQLAATAFVVTGGSTGIAIGANGAILALVAKKVFKAISSAAGLIGVTWTDTGTETFNLGVRLPNGRVVLSGHSAGGHLTAAILAAPRERLRFDPNSALCLADAIAFGKGIEDLANDYFEDPVWGMPQLVRLKEFVKLPTATNTVDKPEVQGQTVIAIAKDKGIYLNAKQIGEGELATKVTELLENSKDKVVLIKADEEVEYGAVMAAMDQLRQAGIEDIGLITERKKEAGGGK